MFGSIVGRFKTPKFLSSDNDPLFEFHRWKANLRVLEINEIKSVLYVPLSHPFIERLIGTIRREFLDHVPFWGDRDLERKLESFLEYYNHARCHQSLGGRAPDPPELDRSQPFAKPSNCEWKSHCRGLYQLPIAA
jgi:transposase InsO family protein